jgi:uncharacterized GH25 family protein
MLNTVVDCTNAVGFRWPVWLVAVTLDSAVLFALVGLVGFVLRKRVAPQFGYRLFLILHFFDPIIRIANRYIHQLRKFACDDLATSLSNSTSVETGEAFLQIPRHAQRNPRGLEGALGLFGLDSRSNCFLRVRRLLDSERPIRTRIVRGALAGLIVLAVAVVPNLRAGGDQSESEPTAVITDSSTTSEKLPPKTEPNESLAKDKGEFQLRVVGPDGKPVGNVQVDLRMSPAPTAEQIRQGTFVRKSNFGAFVTTDPQGRLLLTLPTIPRQLNANITTPGYGPYWATWTTETQAIPAFFTAELEAGWSIGGVIIDDAGQPIEGADVHPNLSFKKRPGDNHHLGFGSIIKTDGSGKWRFDSVPGSKTELFVEINHPSFMPNRRRLLRDEFGIEPGQEPVSRIELNRGLTVTGKVTDEAGKPIVGVLVRTKLINSIREAKTGDDGVYRLSGCESAAAKIVVSAKGRATDMRQLRIEPEMAPVDFQMQPGGTVRVQVLNDQGQPVPKARIFFQRWRGHFSYFEFNHVSQYADENGVWEWNEAPLDEFQADICPPNGMTLEYQPLIARVEPHVFRTPPSLVLTGKVFDAETNQPISKFLAIPGYRSDRVEVYWERDEGCSSIDGTYRLLKQRRYPANFVRIEADGYHPIVSRMIKSDEGNVTLDFQLKQGEDVAAIVTTPDGQPAAGAQVALGIAGSRISISNGRLRNTSTTCLQQESNADGQFRFPPQGEPFELVILHPTGFAHLKPKPDAVPRRIQLESWARLEGTYKIEKKPGENVNLTITSSGLQSFRDGAPQIFSNYFLTTGKEGRFLFDRVVPGTVRISRRFVQMVNEGFTEVGSTAIITTHLTSGETTHIDLGGGGRTVIGQIVPPAGFQGKVKWNFASIHIRSDLAPVPPPDDPDIPAAINRDPVKKAEWLRNWLQTAAGKVWLTRSVAAQESERLRESSPVYLATIAPDGTFRIHDIPTGNYVFTAIFGQQGPGILQDYRFTIPDKDTDHSDAPVDLGVLRLERRE